MKLPFDLGVKLFFRLLLPGFVLSLGIAPMTFMLVDYLKESFHYPISFEIAFIITIMLMGWLIVVLDMPIYMLFEGRRFWPKSLREFFIAREQSRLKRIDRDISQEQIDYNKYLEASVEKLYFPIDENGTYKPNYPSRFGNLLTAYETYPDRRYGMDGIFFWNRIWLKLDKDTREDIDGRQALADSTLYVSFALFVTGFICLLYIVISLYEPIRCIPGRTSSVILFFICILSGYVVYRLSLYIHGQFGEVIKAMFDVYSSKIDQDILNVLDEVIYFTNDQSLKNLPRREKYRLSYIYLQFYLVECPKCGESISPPLVKQHYIELHAEMNDNDKD
jgi:hypothetical protein